jgi:uncharacterized Zn finger protein (UPF0148 family)
MHTTDTVSPVLTTATAEMAAIPAKPKAKASFGRMTCPECGVKFTRFHHSALFCSPAHQRAFHGRNMARGKVAMPYVQAWRSARNRKDDAVVGRYAWAELCRMSDAWAAEDREAGRPGAVDYVRSRMYQADGALAREDKALRDATKAKAADKAAKAAAK